MPHLKIYTTSWCAYCHEEKRFLDQQGIAYTAVDVEADQAAADEMIKLSGQTGVPFTVLTRDDGTEAHVLGFDQAWLTRELKLG